MIPKESSKPLGTYPLHQPPLFSSERSLDYPTKFSFSRPDLGRLGHFRGLQYAHQKGRIACSGCRHPRIRFNARFGAYRG